MRAAVSGTVIGKEAFMIVVARWSSGISEWNAGIFYCAPAKVTPKNVLLCERSRTTAPSTPVPSGTQHHEIFGQVSDSR
jgi:hypothetical protein